MLDPDRVAEMFRDKWLDMRHTAPQLPNDLGPKVSIQPPLSIDTNGQKSDHSRASCMSASLNSGEEPVQSHGNRGPLHSLRRKHRRFALEFPVRFQLRTGSTSTEVEGVSKNVSLGGLLVRSAVAVPADTPVTVVLTLHAGKSVRPVHLTSDGRVVRLEATVQDGVFMIAVQCNGPMTHPEEEHLPWEWPDGT